jgi:soluble P-type ATPase
MQQIQLSISVTGANAEEASTNATGLMDALREAADDIKVRRERADNKAMELGTIVIAVVPSAAVSAVGNGIADWLRHARNASITVRNFQGEVIAKDLTSPDAVRMLEVFHGT